MTEEYKTKYNTALERVYEAFSKGEDLEIFKTIATFKQVWDENAGENQFYHTQDYREIALKLGNLLLTGKMNELADYTDILSMVASDVLVRSLKKSSKYLSDEQFKKLQDYILNLCNDNDKIELAELYRADFKKIQDSLLKTNDTGILLKFYEAYPNRADLPEIYHRIYMINYKNNGSKKVRLERAKNFARIEEYYKKYRAEEQEIFNENHR